jgi:hypothetical protein
MYRFHLAGGVAVAKQRAGWLGHSSPTSFVSISSASLPSLPPTANRPTRHAVVYRAVPALVELDGKNPTNKNEWDFQENLTLLIWKHLGYIERVRGTNISRL